MQFHVRLKHVDQSPKLDRYIRAKMKELEKFIPRRSKVSAVCVLRLEADEAHGHKSCGMELELPKQTLHAEETAGHLYSALDIVVADIKVQLRGYKQQHSAAGLRHRIARGLHRGRNT